MSSNIFGRYDGGTIPESKLGLRSSHGVSRLFADEITAASLRADGVDTAIVAYQLEQLEARVYEYLYPGVKTAEVIPLDYSADPGAETYSFISEDGVAEWAALDDAGDANDAPSSKLRREKDTIIFQSFAHAFGYTLNDLRRAALANIPLETRKAFLAKRAWDEAFEDIVAFGYAGTNLRPLLNYPGVSSEDVASWEDITDPGLLLNAVTSAYFSRIKTLSEIGELTPNRWVLPPSVYMHLATTQFAITGGGGTTIYAGRTVMDMALDAIRKEAPDFEFVRWRKCTLAEPGGVRHRTLLYRFDPDVVKAVSSVEFEMLPIQPKAYGFTVPCHARTAGVVAYRPLGLHYVDISPKA